MTTATISYNTGATYTGFELIELTESSPTTQNSGNSDAWVSNYSGGDYRHSIARIALPLLGAVTISAAELDLYHAQFTPPMLDTRQLLVPFVVSEATWNKRNSSANWTTAGALGNGTDRNSTVIATGGAVSSAYFPISGAGLITALEAAFLAGDAYIYLQFVANGAEGQFSRYANHNEGSGTQSPKLVFTYELAGSAAPSNLLLLGVG